MTWIIVGDAAAAALAHTGRSGAGVDDYTDFL